MKQFKILKVRTNKGRIAYVVKLKVYYFFRLFFSWRYMKWKDISKENFWNNDVATYGNRSIAESKGEEYFLIKRRMADPQERIDTILEDYHEKQYNVMI
jgi:hypothetical protein